MRLFLLTLESLLAIATLVFGAIWYFDPGGNWEPLTVLCGALVLLSEISRRVLARSRPASRFNSDGERIRHRENLRKEFQEEIFRCRAEKLREDAIIRHVDRVDNYPKSEESGAGISAWFKVYLMDTFERGIVVALRAGQLKKLDAGYRYVDYANDEKGDLNALLMGDIPYDAIEAVNMDGDKYYYYPHIYCYFDFEGEPYERLWFSQKIDQAHGHPYFEHLADYDDVIANNPSEGKFYFG